MKISKILVPINGRFKNDNLLNTSFALSRHLDCHVDVVHYENDPKEAIPMLGEGMSGALIQDMLNDTKEEYKKYRTNARQLYETVRTKFGTNDLEKNESNFSSSWLETEGNEDYLLSYHSRFNDLIILEKPNADTQFQASMLINVALFETARPVLLCPNHSVKTMFETITVCWNDSIEAVRALQASIPFLERAERVVLLHSSLTEGETSNELSDLQGYLKHHGISAQMRPIVCKSSETIGESLLRVSEDVEADLMVMGGYSHSRMREFILGGVTKDVLEKMEIPVLMMH